MPEFDNDNDRLEQFFRKATNKPEVTFSEDDWMKLEARLEAAEAARPGKVETPTKKIITATILGAVVLLSVGVWWGRETALQAVGDNTTNASAPVRDRARAEAPEQTVNSNLNGAPSAQLDQSTANEDSSPVRENETASAAPDRSLSLQREASSSTERTAQAFKLRTAEENGKPGSVVDMDGERRRRGDYERQQVIATGQQPTAKGEEQSESGTLAPIAADKIRQDLTVSTSELAERNKQRARIELPGAEEADQTGDQTMVEEEHASDKKEHVAKPRLSLLLSFAPDFSGTSLSHYSPPGKAFGGMIHYHPANRWSISAGVVKNYKQYTGAGDDYTPPAGYWKYYTNGVIPETIEGSCSVLEFPIMVQYTLHEGAKSRWLVGGGASSYVMQTESYRYHFAQPNPGAKDGWDSRGSSRFMFNMVNLTVGYERQVIPGLMIGLEPYVKLPIEEIGWSNLRLYSTGASITLRYTLVSKKQTIPIAVRSRGPD